MKYEPLNLESVINNISNQNLEEIILTTEQQSLLDSTKASLLEKMKNGQKFHSIELHSFKEIKNPDPNNPNITSRIEPDVEPLLARGVMVKNLNNNELTLAKEVFGVVVENSEGYFFPVDLAKKDKVQLVLEDVSLKFSNTFNESKLATKYISKSLTTGGLIASVNKIGIKAALANITAKFTGGALVLPGILPVLGGMAVAGAAIGSAFAVSPLTQKVNQIRQAIKDKHDGDEMQMAINAVEKIDYSTITSTERSNLLPKLTAEIEARATDPSRTFEKKFKIR